MNEDNGILKAALWYLNKGFSIIPVGAPKADDEGRDIKKPIIEWTPLQQTKPDRNAVNSWFQAHPERRIGIVTGKISNLLVVDIDSEEAHQKIESDYLPESLVVPKARSPRGGYHYYFQHVEGIRNKTKVANMDLDVRAEGGFIMAPPSAGLNGSGYRWLPGCEIWKVAIPELPHALVSVFSSITHNNIYSTNIASGVPTNSSGALQSVTSVTNRDKKIPIGKRDDAIFHLANYLVRGGMPEQEIEQYLELIAIHGVEGEFDLRAIPEKIKSALNRSNRGLKDDLLSWVSVTKGDWSVTECDKELNIVTKRDKENRRQILHRLVKDGTLERNDKRNGFFRLVDTTCTALDFNDVSEEEFIKDIDLPFGLDHYARLAWGNLIVIAGVTNAGKSALMLNIIQANMRKYPCYYFSSEMSAGNCKTRCLRHEMENNWNFKIIEDWGGNADVLKPDALNFIDWLEMEEAWRVPFKLSELQKKVKKGLVFVALQKNPNNKAAIGGYQTMNKSALYLTVDTEQDRHILRVKKCKAYLDENPRGFFYRFRIFRGINLQGDGIWMPE